MSSTKGRANPFIVSNGVGKADAETRRLIRSHVMLGKNLGKSQYAKRKRPKDFPKSPGDMVISNDGASGPLGTLVKPSHLTIPKKVGSDLSFVQFADTLAPSTLADVLKFTSLAKKILFPLERCFSFDRKDRRWFEPLTFDAAYLNAVVFSTQAYIDLMLGHKGPTAGQGATIHFMKTVRLLRERLLLINEQSRFSDSTVFVVLTLAMISHHIGEHEAAKHHLDGLRKIVDLRGGLDSFRYIPKLLIEILRCDIGIALHTGVEPSFCLESTSSESLLRYPDQTLHFIPQKIDTVDSRYKTEEFLNNIDDDLATAWGVVQRFCCMINLAAEANHKFPQADLLHTMASVMYRLLYMHFEHGSLDEVIRIGLLAFSSSIFLQWQDVRPSYSHLPNAYRGCLAGLKGMEGVAPPPLLWLLFIGAISVFSEPEDHAWLKLWLQREIKLSGVQSWCGMRQILKSFLWIDLVHDKPGQKVFDSVVASK